MKLNEYRLNSLEEPTDEMLHEIMEQVAVAARESYRRSQEEMDRRLKEVAQRVAVRRSQLKSSTVAV